MKLKITYFILALSGLLLNSCREIDDIEYSENSIDKNLILKTNTTNSDSIQINKVKEEDPPKTGDNWKN